MGLSLSLMVDVVSEPPGGGLSPLAWAIIVALVAVITAVVPALWVRGNKLQDKMYEDLKKCNEKNTQVEDGVLGLLKVLRLQMERSRGVKKE